MLKRIGVILLSRLVARLALSSASNCQFQAFMDSSLVPRPQLAAP